jgi:segregation and condensation protein A
MQDLDLYKLLKVYQKVLERYEINKNRPVHEVIRYPYTIEQQKDYLLESLTGKARLSFEEVIQRFPNKIAVIFNFLAILELLQLRKITLHLGEGFNNFWIEKLEGVEAE